MNKQVFVVICYNYEDTYVDSVWSSEENAENYAEKLRAGRNYEKQGATVEEFELRNE